jgi:hypothetical protein
VRTNPLLMFALERLYAHLLWRSHPVRLVINLLPLYRSGETR